MKFVSDKEIIIDRELSDLDVFTMDFVRILCKHTKYVIVSGYVSILLGRARASEDIDVIIPKIDLQQFHKLLEDIENAGLYCLNEEKLEDVFDHLNEGLAVRFARKGDVIPNIEMKFAKNKIDELAIENRLKVNLGRDELMISQLELQIAFKEVVLKSQKDIEDARHIRNVAEKYLKKELIEKYRGMLNELYR